MLLFFSPSFFLFARRDMRCMTGRTAHKPSLYTKIINCYIIFTELSPYGCTYVGLSRNDNWFKPLAKTLSDLPALQSVAGTYGNSKNNLSQTVPWPRPRAGTLGGIPAAPVSRRDLGNKDNGLSRNGSWPRPLAGTLSELCNSSNARLPSGFEVCFKLNLWC